MNIFGSCPALKVDSRHDYDEESLHNGLLPNTGGVGYGRGVVVRARKTQSSRRLAAALGRLADH